MQKADENYKWKDTENRPRLGTAFQTCNDIPDTYTNIRKYAFEVLSIFGSTYVCEQLFSTMNYVENTHCLSLADDRLQSRVKMKVIALICGHCAQRSRSRSPIDQVPVN